MPNESQRRGGHKAETKVPPGNNGAKTQEPITLEEAQKYIEQLQSVSAVAAKLFALVGEHVSALSSTAPVQRGHKTLDDLKCQAEAHRDGLTRAFDPLHEQIKLLKKNFWEQNREVIGAAARKYTEQKVKERVAIEVEQVVKRYHDHLANNERKNGALKTIMIVSHARTENSLLQSKYLDEKEAWVVDGEDPNVCFQDLVVASETRLVSLANSLNLEPGEEDSQISTLNKVFHQLGIQYRGIPSRSGVLLIPRATNLG